MVTWTGDVRMPLRWWGSGPTVPAMRFALLLALLAASVAGAQEYPTLVMAKCSACHPVPRPTSMPRHAWPKVADTMAYLMERANFPFTEPELEEILDFYIANSPVALEQIPDDLAEPGLVFQKQSIGRLELSERPQVTSVKFAEIDGDPATTELVVTDNNHSNVSVVTRDAAGAWSERTIARMAAPVNTTPVDFDQDGDLDLAVSTMGSIYPNDDLIGEFHLLVNDGQGSFEDLTLLSGVPRITDCAPGDYDGDGDIDFVIAFFGWRYTGMIGLLRQEEGGFGPLETILEGNGAMRILRNDADGDGNSDFVVLITQQHETILQFRNRGDGTFEGSVIARANHPAFGSSSIFLQDLDGDGDEDLLYTNGDMMDENPEPKPYHGVRWLENKGDGQYELHYLAGMPGCYDAKPVDMDGDGDLDVVYSALNFFWDQHDFPTLAWLENLGGFREFRPRRIDYAPTNLANIAVGDVDGDGKPDIVGGGMHVPGPLDRKGRLTLWRQE